MGISKIPKEVDGVKFRFSNSVLLLLWKILLNNLSVYCVLYFRLGLITGLILTLHMKQ